MGTGDAGSLAIVSRQERAWLVAPSSCSLIALSSTKPLAVAPSDRSRGARLGRSGRRGGEYLSCNALGRRLLEYHSDLPAGPGRQVRSRFRYAQVLIGPPAAMETRHCPMRRPSPFLNWTTVQVPLCAPRRRRDRNRCQAGRRGPRGRRSSCCEPFASSRCSRDTIVALVLLAAPTVPPLLSCADACSKLPI